MTSPRERLALVPLRVRLVAVVLALVAVGLTVAGYAATSSLRDYLFQRVDTQLAGTVSGNQIDLFQLTGGPGGGAGQGALNRYFVETFDTNGRNGRVLSPTQTPGPRLPTLAMSTVDGQDGQLFTVPAVSGPGRWRAVATLGQIRGDVVVVVVASELTELDRTVARLIRTELLVGAGVLALLALVAYAVVRQSLRPLRDVEQTAAAIAGGDLSLRVPRQDDRTEVGRLALAFNSMLGRIEGAFRAQQDSEAQARGSEAKMRQFVGDASHELRTPLTSIRGFAELYRQGAVPAGPDLDRVMGRVEGEATRMGQLVEEMLLLARLDQQRPLETTRVDLLHLAADAVHDAQAVDPDRPIRLAVDERSEAPVVLGDEARLRQVLVNLLGNAVTHTPAGTAVTVRVRTSGRTALLEVADRGPGLSSEQASKVFERFYRVDTARTRASGGSGLGLSIVRAVVEAHGGRVGVRSTPGCGASFLVELPLAG